MCIAVEPIARELIARGLPLDEFLEDLRAAAVRLALREHKSTAKAARALAMDRKTFRRIRDRQPR